MAEQEEIHQLKDSFQDLLNEIEEAHLTIGTLDQGEPHPAYFIAKDFIVDHLSTYDVFSLQESLASSSLTGNRSAEIAGETLRRLLNKEPVSDRYLMGLAWVLWGIENE